MSFWLINITNSQELSFSGFFVTKKPDNLSDENMAIYPWDILLEVSRLIRKPSWSTNQPFLVLISNTENSIFKFLSK